MDELVDVVGVNDGGCGLPYPVDVKTGGPPLDPVTLGIVGYDGVPASGSNAFGIFGDAAGGVNIGGPPVDPVAAGDAVGGVNTGGPPVDPVAAGGAAGGVYAGGPPADTYAPGAPGGDKTGLVAELPIRTF